MRNTESLIQQAFVRWCWINERKYPELKLGFAVPNQSNRHIRNAVRMKKEGLRAGVPDWMMPVSSRLFNGLAIEFKSPKGKLTEEQARYHALLIKHAWQVVVCRSWKEAADVVIDYLK